MLPYASEYLTEIALETSPSFAHDAIDQYLSTVAMDMDYIGDGETVGTATLIELDDEDRVVLTLVHAIAHGDDPRPQDWADDAAVIMWSASYKWWGDSDFYRTIDAAKAKFEAFEQEWVATFPCEDCGSEDQASCICNVELPEGLHIGQTVKVEGYGGVAWRILGPEAGGNVSARMVGDDRDFSLDPSLITPVEGEVCECGQLDCGWGTVDPDEETTDIDRKNP